MSECKSDKKLKKSLQKLGPWLLGEMVKMGDDVGIIQYIDADRMPNPVTYPPQPFLINNKWYGGFQIEKLNKKPDNGDKK